MGFFWSGNIDEMSDEIDVEIRKLEKSRDSLIKELHDIERTLQTKYMVRQVAKMSETDHNTRIFLRKLLNGSFPKSRTISETKSDKSDKAASEISGTIEVPDEQPKIPLTLGMPTDNRDRDRDPDPDTRSDNLGSPRSGIDSAYSDFSDFIIAGEELPKLE